MIPDITIKISFGKEAAEIPGIAKGATLPYVEIAPPDTPGENIEICIPPPPGIDESEYAVSSEDYPPPPEPGDENEQVILAPSAARTKTKQGKI